MGWQMLVAFACGVIKLGVGAIEKILGCYRCFRGDRLRPPGGLRSGEASERHQKMPRLVWEAAGA